MITRIHLKNFRRHLDTDLEFGPQDQLIAICGVNGSGKTTILEGLLFSLFGETRNGRRGLDTLVSRGQELEGVEVTCEMTLAGTSYRVVRKRVEGIPSALLFADGQLLSEGISSVDAKVKEILGMDSAGFKLAVIAKQKELDGLTSLSRQQRRFQLARLLRVDVVGRAAGAAHTEFLRNSELLGSLGKGADIDAMLTEKTSEESKKSQLNKSLVKISNKIAEKSQELDLLKPLKDQYAVDIVRHAEVVGAYSSVVEEVDALKKELADLRAENVGDTTEVPDSKKILADLRDLEVEKSLITANKQAAIAWEALTEQHRDVVISIAGINKTLASVSSEKILDKESEAKTNLVLAEQAKQNLDTKKSHKIMEQDKLSEDIKKLESLVLLGEGGSCPTCGSVVSVEHAEAKLLKAQKELLAEEVALKIITKQSTATIISYQNAVKIYEETIRLVGQHTSRLEQAQNMRNTLPELVTKRDAYETRLNLEKVTFEKDSLQKIITQISALEEELKDSEEAEVTRLYYEKLSQSIFSVQQQLVKATNKKEKLKKELDEVSIADEVVKATHDSNYIVERINSLTGTKISIEADIVRLQANIEMCELRLENARQFEERRQKYASQARVAAYAKATLKSIHAALSQELRPNLEIALTTNIAKLSEGRFTAAKVTEDYEISILDDGKYHLLSEFSGGEVDLIALALRLSLAQVVGERHGSDSLGVLILDEIFGSQDAGRREAIITGLRELRSMYGQIFVISHVGGIEDYADKVIELNCGEDRKLLDVAVL